MITLKTKEQIEYMKKAGEILAACHREIAKMIRPGITTQEIDQFAEAFMKKNGATPEQKGYNGYQYATCASVNDVICHGFPGKYALKDGDIVTIDMVVNLNGWLADSAWSYAVGEVTPEAQHLLDVTKNSLYKGIELAVVGNRIGDISNAIQVYAEGEGLSVVREFIGHGIGEKMHEEPQVPHYGPPHRGPRLKEGMVITIEPMLNIGTFRSKLDSDGWTARTMDGSLSAQYEHTIAITADGPVILTAQ
ncbi:type I methionyl aminopeptidase [Paenibacillus polymyxa]|jgi:methionyl aminopeptidase|uniref:type I methionyl aminopeptidase n=1 Tax=Paenibacillus TaxID=44249 RepID=UPI00096F34A3|nr:MULTISPECIES: type I methionyl aminopeptidase [Paenibacillus]UOK64134.1 type I methionyl aminopeptidase [Paenibacillus sp. OVF10]KAA8752562.1 type I methionyl aminopeptidase [Paenibacillus sp. UASWS1643]MCL6662830.1 type I methionyl aminopeptidase [Paenibacillus amylolyticus]MDR6719978.1 methionyl aminopeptidase [Paenibacillus sp. 2003]OMF60422.1 type I methionyl aminopeptidase [Paenibacillus sp. FSL R5-0765]